MRAEIVYDRGSGTRKAAILLLSLGDEVAREVFRRISEDELRQLGVAAGQLRDVTVREVMDVLDEFRLTFAGDYIPSSGAGDVLQVMIERAIGVDRARALLDAPGDEDPFAFCERVDPRALARALEREHPQTAAIVLAAIDPKRGALVVDAMSSALASEIVERIASIGEVSDDLMRDIAATLREELRHAATGGGEARDGSQLAVSLLKKLDASRADELMDSIGERDAALAEGLRAKLFTFEDLAKLDARAMQRLMRQVDSRALAVALKSADADLQAAFLSGMSSRAAELLRDDIEASGPARIADIEQAQASILAAALELDADGQIVLPRGDLDAMG